ncbi:TonB-dependent receptor [Adhaeribacter radiodurans]|uniref:TonB-dependent receptor n=1 Tax=Adhaeribacter radiodurans TaxID=2745197 RepID=A0A7L7L9P2_9BACT|nr:TonB-dependent receptor [Adhaeribacter radiodurans]QMU29444.1 TonB-dependent receptor [Adhaeribacter radiodurans]
MKHVLLLWVFLVGPFYSFAQYTVSGRVVDALSQKPLIGATVQINRTGTTTNEQGFYQLSAIPAGKQTLAVSYLGYETGTITLKVQQDITQNVTLNPTSLRANEVVITATRANDKTGTTFTNVDKKQISERNFGQDLTYLLEQTPSVVVNSDAGAGVGYTGIRIRGSDITRINVTVNGIPVNDAESHGAFFVNMPDLASSVQDIQVQRGVGTSTNGAGAFGASLNMRTIGLTPEPYAEVTNTFGSFNTWRHSVSFGTGLMHNKFTIDGRLSKISSDGYIDRAFSKLKSYYFAAGYTGKTGMLKFVTFSGQEQTYQAWNGVPEDSLKTNRTYNSLTYNNETDNYQQDHYQLHYSKTFGSLFDFGGAFHLTRGKGYYEQYKNDQSLANYNLPPVILGDTTISRTDLIRRKWLDNYFYGATYALNYHAAQGLFKATLGGSWNRYDGDHYGEVIWARFASNSEIRQRYYQGEALKTDFTVYGKVNYQATDQLSLFGDVQSRIIHYELAGTDDNQRDVTQQANFTFLNPKAGITYAFTPNQTVYASYAVGNREPVRSDFVDRKGSEQPKAETMYNLEAGYRLRENQTYANGRQVRYSLDANYYYMDYYNQLVLTGQLNDVGSPLRTNIKRSYRTGVELAGLVNWNDKVEFSSTVTLSRNKIKNYLETVYVYDADYNVENTVENTYAETDISFSPNFISAHKLEIQPVKGLRAALLYKTVSKQYLDNTSNDLRQIKGYQVADVRLRYTIQPKFMKELVLGLLINNILNKKYEANGYTFSEQYSGDPTRYDYNYYYPQATRNFLLSVGVKF